MPSNLLPEFVHAFPEIFLCFWAVLVLLVGVFQKKKEKESIFYIALIGLALTLYMVIADRHVYHYAFNDVLRITPFTQVMKAVILILVAAILYMSIKHLVLEHMHRIEYPVLILLATLGMMVMISANDLIAVFLGLEIQSLSLYILVAMTRDRLNASEAGIKYFVLGALATAFFLFGASYLYGFTGTTEFHGMATVLRGTAILPLPITIALLMILIALGFKVSLVPFHMWTPDVYEGSPTPVTLFLAAAPKLAGFVLLMNFLTIVFHDHASLWLPLLQAFSFITMLVGSFAALFQKKLKRLLAYSTISHMGFALLGFLTLKQEAYENIFNYLILYSVMTVGAFGFLLCMRKRGQLLDNIDDLTGLSKESPVLALCMVVMLFSLAGVPPFAGFFAKLMVFQNALGGGHTFLVVVAVLASVVSVGYYLRIIKVMYFDVPLGGERIVALDSAIPLSTRLVLYLTTAIISFYVLMPNLITLRVGEYLR
jgi:NADH-quinone oxidoreductase subunit N